MPIRSPQKAWSGPSTGPMGTSTPMTLGTYSPRGSGTSTPDPNAYGDTNMWPTSVVPDSGGVGSVVAPPAPVSTDSVKPPSTDTSTLQPTGEQKTGVSGVVAPDMDPAGWMTPNHTFGMGGGNPSGGGLSVGGGFIGGMPNVGLYMPRGVAPANTPRRK